MKFKDVFFPLTLNQLVNHSLLNNLVYFLYAYWSYNKFRTQTSQVGVKISTLALGENLIIYVKLANYVHINWDFIIL